MTTLDTVSEAAFRGMVAERSGPGTDELFIPVLLAARRRALIWPVPRGEVGPVLDEILDELRRPLPPRRTESAPHSRYVWLSEITGKYEHCDTRRVLERIMHAGVTPVGMEHGEGYDPRSERGWGLRPPKAPDPVDGLVPEWSWWRAVLAAGPRPEYRMPDPYAGEGDPPVDQALDLLERTGDEIAFRQELYDAVRRDHRMIDCWAHLGSSFLNEADAAPPHEASKHLSTGLGYFQTAVAVAELSLPDEFTGVLTWGQINNRPFHRALHGLGLVWWRLGCTSEATAVFANSLWTNPEDNQGVRFLVGQAQAEPGPTRCAEPRLVAPSRPPNLDVLAAWPR